MLPGPRIIVGFGCKRRRGKDTCCRMAKELLEEWGYKVRLDGFALSLKEGIGKGVFGLTDEQLYGAAKFDVDPFWGLTPRDILQRGGTEAMRNTFGQDIWVQTLERRASADPETSVLICDVRFPNEVEGLRRLGGYAVLVDRPLELVPTAASPEEDQHASETSLDHFTGWDFCIENDSSLEHLREEVRGMLIAIVSSSQVS
jgi:hypothetical protein